MSESPLATLDASATSFAGLGVPKRLTDALATRGIVSPTPIQVATLPPALEGRDVLGRARTGSGKTLAFALPLVLAVDASSAPRRPRRPRALVLVPTRELAAQVHETLKVVAQPLGLRCTTIIGGVGQGPQVAALRNGVDVLVACPGRLEDLIAQGECKLDDIVVTVLDEADHMADVGFVPAVRRLLDATPARSQRLLFSATLDATVAALVKRYLHDPAVQEVDEVGEAPSTMVHHFFTVVPSDRFALVHQLAGDSQRSLLFVRTKHAARKLARQLTVAGVPAVDLHGNLSQGARTRNLDAFASGEVRVLVATDIAARGVHVDDVATVVHVDPPTEHKAYLHRSGRTARAGNSGVVITLAPPEQANEIRKLASAAGLRNTVVHHVTPGHPRLSGLSDGDAASAAHVAAVAAEPDRAPRPSGRQPANGRPGGNGRGRSGGRGQNAGRGQGGGRGQSSSGASTSGRASSGRTQAAARNAAAAEGTARPATATAPAAARPAQPSARGPRNDGGAPASAAARARRRHR